MYSLASTFKESVVGNFHQLLGLESKIISLESKTSIYGMPCAFEGQGWSPDHPD